MLKKIFFSSLLGTIVIVATMASLNIGGLIHDDAVHSQGCSIAPDGLDVNVEFLIENCALVFTWNTHTTSEPGTSELFWTTDPRGQCGNFPNHKVNPTYTYNNSISLDVSYLPVGAIKFYVRSTAPCGTWYQLPIVWEVDEYVLDCKKVTFPRNCEPLTPHQE